MTIMTLVNARYIASMAVKGNADAYADEFLTQAADCIELNGFGCEMKTVNQVRALIK